MDRILSSIAHMDVSLVTQIAQMTDLKLGLDSSKVAIIKQIVFHASVSDVDSDTMLAVSSREENNTLETQDDVELSGAIIARELINNQSAGGFLWSFVHPIPDPGWVVSGDLQLIAVASANVTIDVSAQVYYTVKSVSLFEWMIAKKAY